MNTRIEILSFLFIIAAVQGYILMVLILRRRKKQPAYLWLGLLVGLISSATLGQAFEISELLLTFIPDQSNLNGIIDPLIWLFGPFYFFFIHSLLKSRKLKVWEYLIHFFPAGVKMLALISFWVLSGPTKLKIIQDGKNTSAGWLSEEKLFLLAILLYLIWGLLEFFQFKRAATGQKGLHSIIYSNLFLLIIWCFHAMVLALPDIQLSALPQNNFLIVLAWTTGIYALGYAHWKYQPIMGTYIPALTAEQESSADHP